MASATRYVCGFLSVGDEVLLIRKTKPEWQAGRLNGVGGKIEGGELPVDAMVREFREEAGLKTNPGRWHSIYSLSDTENTFMVYFFALVRDSKEGIVTCTEEELVWCRASALPFDVIPNLRWLVPMSRDPGTWKHPYTAGVVHA